MSKRRDELVVSPHLCSTQVTVVQLYKEAASARSWLRVLFMLSGAKRYFFDKASAIETILKGLVLRSLPA
jgi:hypothetical protein